MKAWRRVVIGMIPTVLTTSGCAFGGAPTAVPDDVAVPRLEATRQRDPSDRDAALMLASAYLFAGRAEEAAAIVSAVEARHPRDPIALLLRGAVDEEAGNAVRARAAYRAYVDARTGSAFEVDVQGRLERLEAEALREEIRGAVASGRTLAAELDPTAVVVLPLANRTGDPDADAFAAAVAELLAMDLSITDRLHAVDRGRVAVALRELAPDPTTWDDPALAERIGRQLGAGFVVYGALVPDEIGGWLSRGFVAPLGAQPGRIPFDMVTQPRALYTFAKQLAMSIYARTGIQLTPGERFDVENAALAFQQRGDPTPAERNAVRRGQSQLYEALMELGRGLLAADAGRLEDAAARFDAAVREDVTFTLARQRAARARAFAASAQPPRLLAWAAAQTERQLREIAGLTGGAPHQRALRALGARDRAVLAEILGHGLGSGTLLEIDFVLGTP